MGGGGRARQSGQRSEAGSDGEGSKDDGANSRTLILDGVCSGTWQVSLEERKGEQLRDKRWMRDVDRSNSQKNVASLLRRRSGGKHPLETWVAMSCVELFREYC